MFSLTFTVKRAALIHKPADEVFKQVADFGTWPKWSPWLCHEPECPVEVSGAPASPGHSQKWNGNRIGSGELLLKAVEPSSRLDYDLHFISPWKSHSKVSFQLTPDGENTNVEWDMEGTVPVFLFFLRKMMSAWVGADYDRGLSMLRELLESGEVPTKVDFRGDVNRSGFHYVGRRSSCPLGEVGPAMERDFKELFEMVENGNLPKPDFHFSFYHNWDFAGGSCEYTSGFGYTSPPRISDGSATLETGQVPAHRALQVDHIGPYRHLGNAWSGAMNAQRSLKKKVLKQIPMYEVYVSLPGDVPEQEIRTEIFIPIK